MRSTALKLCIVLSQLYALQLTCAAAPFIGVEGISFGESSVVKAYAGIHLTENIRVLGFGLQDKYKDQFTDDHRNEYEISGSGVGLQYLIPDSNFYIEVNGLHSKVDLVGVKTAEGQQAMQDKTSWVGASVGYDYPIYGGLYGNIVLGSQVSLKTVDLKLPNAELTCDGPGLNRFCIEKGKVTNQIRFGLSYRF